MLCVFLVKLLKELVIAPSLGIFLWTYAFNNIFLYKPAIA
jgi:hypothetical protein